MTKITSLHNNTSTCPEVFCKKSILRNFAKLTGKHMYEKHKLQALGTVVFFVHSAKVLRIPIRTPPMATSLTICLL